MRVKTDCNRAPFIIALWEIGSCIWVYLKSFGRKEGLKLRGLINELLSVGCCQTGADCFSTDQRCGSCQFTFDLIYQDTRHCNPFAVARLPSEQSRIGLIHSTYSKPLISKWYIAPPYTAKENSLKWLQWIEPRPLTNNYSTTAHRTVHLFTCKG